MELSGFLVGVFLTFACIVFGFLFYAKLFHSGVIGVEEYHLTSYFEKALGISEGTKVQINGVEVGRVSKIILEAKDIKMKLTIRKKYQDWITDSAVVYAIRDQNVISSRVMNIDVQKRGRVLQDGEIIASGQAQDLETMLETANDLLHQVGDLVKVADTIVTLVMDTGTTIGALLGSRALYDNLNTQLLRLDKITNLGTSLLVNFNQNVPTLFKQSETMLNDMQNLLNGMENVPNQVNNMFTSMDNLFDRMDTLVTNVDGMSKSLSGFITVGEKTLEGAENIVDGMSNMWIIRRSIPEKDSIPFTVETLW